MSQTELVVSAVKIRHPLMDHQRKQNMLQMMDVPLRSRLYGLAPCEVRTIWRESLTSYLNRLGWKHGVSPRALVAQEILPSVSHADLLHVPSQFASFCRAKAATLNGLGESAREWTSRLEQLTARPDLHYLTLHWWIGDLPSRKFVREKAAWCPFCYAEWKEKGDTIYQPLLWSFQVVMMCIKHQQLLEDRCPSCKKSQSFLALKTLPGYCTQCNMWLGTTLPPSAGHLADSETTEWQIWVTRSLEELLQASLDIGILSWESFFANLAAKSTFTRLFKLTGMPGVLQWSTNRSHRITPSLAAILKFCYVCKVTPLQVMSNHLAPLEQVLQRRVLPRATWFSPGSRQIDLKRFQKLLQSVLDGQEELLGISQIAERLECSESTIQYHFPQEYILIRKRTQELRKQRGKNYAARVCEEVKKAVYLLHAQGVFPSTRLVAGMLSNPDFMRRSDALESLHATRRELGLEQ